MCNCVYDYHDILTKKTFSKSYTNPLLTGNDTIFTDLKSGVFVFQTNLSGTLQILW